jgi:hypothetical protein
VKIGPAMRRIRQPRDREPKRSAPGRCGISRARRSCSAGAIERRGEPRQAEGVAAGVPI